MIIFSTCEVMAVLGLALIAVHFLSVWARS